MSSKYIILFLCLLSEIIFGQSTVEKLIHGKIIVDNGTVVGVTIVNLVNEKSTVSDSNGDFYILAKAEDLLVFSSVNLEYYRKIIELEDLKSDILLIKMTPKITELKEVVINAHPEINAVSLGISPKGIVHLTQVERRLYTANSTPVVALINSISGRTAMIKKEIKVEKKLTFIKQLENMFEEDYFKNTLKIPSEYIKGFQYYVVENENFTKTLKSKSKTNIEFVMGELAIKYNEIISSENKK